MSNNKGVIIYDCDGSRHRSQKNGFSVRDRSGTYHDFYANKHLNKHRKIESERHPKKVHFVTSRRLPNGTKISAHWTERYNFAALTKSATRALCHCTRHDKMKHSPISRNLDLSRQCEHRLTAPRPSVHGKRASEKRGSGSTIVTARDNGSVRPSESTSQIEARSHHGSKHGSVTGPNRTSNGNHVPKSSSKVGSEARSKAGSKAISKADSKAGSKQGSRAESKAGSKIGSKAASKAGTKVGSKVQSQAGSKSGSKTGNDENTPAAGYAEDDGGNQDDDGNIGADDAPKSGSAVGSQTKAPSVHGSKAGSQHREPSVHGSKLDVKTKPPSVTGSIMKFGDIPTSKSGRYRIEHIHRHVHEHFHRTKKE